MRSAECTCGEVTLSQRVYEKRCSDWDANGKVWCFLKDGLKITDSCKEKTNASLEKSGEHYYSEQICKG